MKPLATIGWGVYCACSWTWCIGMFLPLILLDRFGWPGVLAFAIPNVLGCAAFGYVLRDRERSRRFVRDHRTAVAVFSLVTLAYHAYFFSWAAAALLPDLDPWTAPFAGVTIIAAAVIVSLIPDRVWPIVAAGVYAVSLTALFSTGFDPLAALSASGRFTTADLGAVIPVVVFGFALCPYLDATFHRALQRSPSRHAFGVFGVTFAIMLVLTCVYADAIGSWSSLILTHLIAQGVFTCAVHLRELRRAELLGISGGSALLTALPAAASLIVLIARPAPTVTHVNDGHYMRFLAFYGLLFPAYVLFFAGPGRIMQRTPASLIVAGLAVIVAAPFYEIGFLHDTHGWLVLGLGIVIATKIVIMMKTPRTALA